MIKIDGNVKNITGKAWRLVHDGIRVLALIEGTVETITTTKHEIEEFDTEEQAFERIKVLGLELNNEYWLR